MPLAAPTGTARGARAASAGREIGENALNCRLQLARGRVRPDRAECRAPPEKLLGIGCINVQVQPAERIAAVEFVTHRYRQVRFARGTSEIPLRENFVGKCLYIRVDEAIRAVPGRLPGGPGGRIAVSLRKAGFDVAGILESGAGCDCNREHDDYQGAHSKPAVTTIFLWGITRAAKRSRYDGLHC